MRNDNRFKAGISIDGGFYEKEFDRGFDKPFMMILAEKFFLVRHDPSQNELEHLGMNKQEFMNIVSDNELKIKKLFEHLDPKKSSLFVIKNAYHNTFSDWFLFILTSSGRINAIKGINITRQLVLNFFDHYLKQKKVDYDIMDDSVEKLCCALRPA